MKRIVVRLSRGARRRLERLAQKTRDAEYRIRILIVLHYAAGLGSVRIARALAIVPNSAVRVVHRYLEHGERGLLDGRRENGTPKVDDDMLQALTELLQDPASTHGWKRPTWTREMLVKSLAQRTGVQVSVTTLSRMLQQIGARLGSARPTVVCPWPKARKQARVAEVRRIIENLQADEVAYYEDEVDIHLNPRIGRDWMLPGQQRVIVTPGRNEKSYVAGALRADGSGLVFVAAKRKNTDLFIALLKKLREQHPTAVRIHLILDNYVIHSSKRLLKYLDEANDLFALHFLPPYSPEHNKIERCWRELHANVTRNHRCPSMRALMAEVRAHLSAEDRKRRRRSRQRSAVRNRAA